MKKILLFFIFVVFIISFSIFWFYKNVKPASSDKAFKDFLITKGTSASQVGNNLYKQGLIKSSLVFKIYIQISGKSGRILAGEYRLSPNLNLFQMVNQLGKGPVEIWVTIPEGLRREEVAIKFTKTLERDDIFLQEFLEASKGKEGMLFPDTYLFPKDVKATIIVAKMISTFKSKTSSLDLTNNQLILASLIERETKTTEERPVVAGILMNRLNIGMALQVDATLQYAKGSWEPISSIDKKVNSPYNTYKFPGLPPGPIANPGLSSIEAAVRPEESNYFYYLHDSKGQIYYAKTLTEHNLNIKKYLQ